MKKSQVIETFSFLGWITGFEPATLGTTNRCSNQLSYIHHFEAAKLKNYFNLQSVLQKYLIINYLFFY